MVTDEEYKEALAAMSHPFKVVKERLAEELKVNCINTTDPEQVKVLQAQYMFLNTIETAIDNNKEDTQ